MEDKLNPTLQNTIIQNTIKDSIARHFPIVTKNRRLELVGPLKISDTLADTDYPLQREIRLSGRNWQVPLIGNFQLIDTKTGTIIDTAKNVKIANIPKMTPRFSMLIGGNEYTTTNQFRLRPGIYTRKKANDEMESTFNLSVGYNFTLMLDPAAGIFYLYVMDQKFHLYTLLHAFGIPDQEILNAWGAALFEKNRLAGLNQEGKEIPLLWEKLKKQKLPYEKALESIKDYFDKTRIDVQTTELTIGKGVDRVTPEALILTSRKLLKVMRGEEKEDERDSLLFKELNTVDDLLTKSMEKKSPRIIKNLMVRTENKNLIKEIISPDTYTHQIIEFFTQGDLSNPSPQTNPVEMLSEWRKTTITGTGGIQSDHAITFKTRDLHPTHFGFLDPLNTPESFKAGVTLALGSHVRKEGNEIKTPIVLPSGRSVHMTPLEFYQKKIGFPDQHMDGKPKFATVKAMYRGESVILKPSDIDGYLAHPTAMFAYTTNLVPFLGNTSGNRSLVAAKMVTQSVPLKHPESPHVKVISETGEFMDKAMGEYLSPAVPSDIKQAIVSKIDDNYVTIKEHKTGQQYKIGLYNNFPLNQESFLHATPTVKPGDVVSADQPIANLNFNDQAGQYAPGLNVNVAYMPWHGYNYEDGIVVTESLAKRFTSTAMLKKTITVASDGILDAKKFQAYYPTVLTPANATKLTESGIVREGEKIQPNELLVAYLQRIDPTDTEMILKQMNRAISQPYRDHSLIWDGEHEGLVTHVRRIGNTITVWIKEEQPLVVGDKLTARYGDKGIVGRIIKDDEAPHTKDGTRIDMILNIHGVSGRMNMGQLLEAAAGKWSAKTKKPYIVENFSGKDHLAEIMKKLQDANIPANEILLDGKDGKPFGNPIFWGNKHYLKLMHVVDHKYKARGLPGSYDANEQPSHGDSGGQSLDPLQMYSLLAHGAKTNLYEMAAVKGQKNDEYWRALQLGLPTPTPQKNFVFDKLLVYMQAAGVDINKSGYNIQLLPATAETILKLSKGELTDPKHALRGKDLAAISGGLFDPKLTGGMKGTNWTHMTLNSAIPNPLYEGAIKSVLKLTGTQYARIMNEEEAEAGKTGSDLIINKLKTLDVTREYNETKRLLNNATPLQVNTLNKRLRYLNVLREHKLAPDKAYVLTILPVMPPIFRPIYPLPSGDIQVAPINKHYRDIALINDQIKLIKNLGVDEKEFNKSNRIELYRAAKSLIGLTDSDNYAQQKYNPAKAEGLLSTIAGSSPKQGFAQNKVWSRRQDLSARSTITVEPSLGLDEVGLPDDMSKTIFHPFIMREIVRQGYRPIQALEEIKKWSPIADQALNNVMKARPVLLNRAPSLHKHSVQALKPIRFAGRSIRVNPLLAKGFNYDFDGDTMSVHVPVSEKAIIEAYTMLPSKNLYKAGDRGHMINIEQDYQLGLYYLSVLGKSSGKRFNTIDEAKTTITDKTEIFTVNNVKMTLGQYFINEVLPTELRDYAREMSAKNMKNLIDTIFTKYPNEFQKIIDTWKELGRHYAVERGSTVSITDMISDRSYRDKILQQYEATIKPSMTKYQIADIYGKAKQDIEAKQDEVMKGKNNFYDMLQAGSTSRKGQITQILSMPGIIEDVHGVPIPYPIKKSWSEGLDSFDYWNSSYGARKGVVDRSVNTQESGALNKELLFNTKNLLIMEADCDTPEGIVLETDSKEVMDRFLSSDVLRVGKRNDLVNHEIIIKAKKANITKLPVRSSLTCETEGGVCQKCYGLLANGQLPRIGENVGVIDSQAVTERSTQLSMQAFHSGGVAGGTSTITKGFPRLEELLFVPQTIKNEAVLSQEDGMIRNILENPVGGFDLYINTMKYYIPRERKLLVSVGSMVKKGDRLTDGSIKPQQLSALRDHLTAQQYVADEINNVYDNKFSRKTFETVLRGVSNNAELTKIPSHLEKSWLRGDVVPLTTVKKINRELNKKGLDLIEYKPFFKSIDVLPLYSDDWLSRLTTNRLRQTVQDAAAQGMSSKLHGTDPMPAYLHATTFGKENFY